MNGRHSTGSTPARITVVAVSNEYLVALGLSVASLLGARLFLHGLPWRRHVVMLKFGETVVLGVGLLLLAFHCVAMFFTSTVERVPGTGAAISDIRALGTVSFIWYAVPALLVLLGLRRLHWAALVVVLVALLLVAVTMYNGGPLNQHLLTIFVAVVSMAATLATVARPPLPTLANHDPSQ